MRRIRKRTRSLKPENLSALPLFAAADEREYRSLAVQAKWVARRYRVPPALALVIAANHFGECPN